MTRLIYALFTSLCLASTAQASPAPNSTPEDLVSIKVKHFDHAAKHKTKPLEANSLFISVDSVNFAPMWVREFEHKIASGYMERIQSSYAELLVEELKEGFSEAGYQVVDSADQADTIVRASLSKLRINGPELQTIARSYVNRAGSATLELKFLDAEDNTLLVLEDNRSTREKLRTMEWATRGSNYRDFKHLVGRWVKNANKALSKQNS
jgi:hypothetical protein